MSATHKQAFIELYNDEYTAEHAASEQSTDETVEGICDKCGFIDEVEIGSDYSCPNCGIGTILDIVTVFDLVD